jgi:hypothetical protein
MTLHPTERSKGERRHGGGRLHRVKLAREERDETPNEDLWTPGREEQVSE